MPRIPPSLLLKARHISPYLPLVLRGTRTVPSAQNELRWLREHVDAISKPQDGVKIRSRRLLQFCRRRARGEPLQYILGSQPFGDLDIRCRPGVLIPRPETEAYTAHLAQLLLRGYFSIKPKPDGRGLRILDLCSGTACISLLLHSLLSTKFRQLQIYGWDVSANAVSLAEENLQRNIAAETLHLSKSASAQFHVVDIFDDIEYLKGHLSTGTGDSSCDIIVSNPPYISQQAFNKETTRSVRNWEPRLALVPQRSSTDSRFAPEDVFYHRLLVLHQSLGSKILVMEVGDDDQAFRVVSMACALGMLRERDEIQIWRDAPDCSPEAGAAESVNIGGRNIRVVGAGRLRAVILFHNSTREDDCS